MSTMIFFRSFILAALCLSVTTDAALTKRADFSWFVACTKAGEPTTVTLVVAFDENDPATTALLVEGGITSEPDSFTGTLRQAVDPGSDVFTYEWEIDTFLFPDTYTLNMEANVEATFVEDGDTSTKFFGGKTVVQKIELKEDTCNNDVSGAASHRVFDVTLLSSLVMLLTGIF